MEINVKKYKIQYFYTPSNKLIFDIFQHSGWWVRYFPPKVAHFIIKSSIIFNSTYQ